MDHGLLLEKLGFYDIRNDQLDLVRSYLSGRVQIVVVAKAQIRNKLSIWHPAGVNPGPTAFSDHSKWPP